MGEEEHAGFSAVTVDASTVKRLKAAMVSGVRKAESHRLATQRVPRLNFWGNTAETQKLNPSLTFRVGIAAYAQLQKMNFRIGHLRMLSIQ